MKTLLLPIFSALLMQLLLLLSFTNPGYTQCTNSSQYPSGSIAMSTTGAVITISTCNFQGEYSVISGAVSGQTIQFTNSLSGSYITVRSGSSGGPVVAHGFSPLSFSNSFTGTLYAHWNTGVACGTDFNCSVTTVQCTSCSGPGGCNNTTSFGSATINSSGTSVQISTCSFAGEYSTISGAVAGQTLQFTYSLSGGFITVRSGTPSGPVVASGNSPLSFANSFTGTLYAHWNTSSACGSNTSCSSTTVQCTSCSVPPPPVTCPAGLGAGTVNIASLPYNGTGLSNCGNGNNLTSANATICGSSSYYGGEDITFIFTPAVSGMYDIVLSSASSWVGLMLYSGCPLSGQGGTCVSNSQSSTGSKSLMVSLTAGTTYYVVVDTWPAPSCIPSFSLSIAAAIPPCNAPGTPVVSNISSTSASVNFAAAAGGVNYDWTVGTGASCPTGTGANTSATSLSLSGLIPNTTYRVCVRTANCGGGAASGYVSTTFTTAPLPNDACAGAQTVTCGSTVGGNTLGAVSDAGLGLCGIGTGNTPGNGVWYKLVGNGAQATISLCGSSYDTKLHVYAGSCAGLTCLTSNDDFCGTQSQVVFNANVGTDYFILVSGFSTATGAFSMNISCLCGPVLGAPWTTTPIGGVNGGGIENVCDNTIDLSSNGYSASSTSDALYFAHQNLCGNQSITVKVNNISNGGFAGIMFRESTAAGSKMVAVKTQLNNFIHRELRSVTNGAKSLQQIAAFGHSWLRLVRNGNLFSGYKSSNGISWQHAFTVTLAMNSCLEVGLFTQGMNPGSISTASFSNVSGFPTGMVTLPSFGGEQIAMDSAPLDFTLFPNPAQSEINVQLGNEFLGKDVTIRVSNQLGQTVMTQRIDEVQSLTERLELNNLAGGLYILSIQTEGQELLSKKFVVGDNRP